MISTGFSLSRAFSLISRGFNKTEASSTAAVEELRQMFLEANRKVSEIGSRLSEIFGQNAQDQGTNIIELAYYRQMMDFARTALGTLGYAA